MTRRTTTTTTKTTRGLLVLMMLMMAAHWALWWEIVGILLFCMIRLYGGRARARPHRLLLRMMRVMPRCTRATMNSTRLVTPAR